MRHRASQAIAQRGDNAELRLKPAEGRWDEVQERTRAPGGYQGAKPPDCDLQDVVRGARGACARGARAIPCGMYAPRTDSRSESYLAAFPPGSPKGATGNAVRGCLAGETPVPLAVTVHPVNSDLARTEGFSFCGLD